MKTILADAIAVAKEEASEVKTVRVDIFDIPEAMASDYMKDRETVAVAAEAVMKPYCVTVRRETLDPAEGESIVGYHINGEVLMSVNLDPFEVPVMKVALQRDALKEYILAANDLTEDMLATLK